MLEKLRKERNIHRMHHRRIAQEKNKLIVDVKVSSACVSLSLEEETISTV